MAEYPMIVTRRRTGPTAPCELCGRLVYHERVKLVIEPGHGTKGSGGYGLYAHPICAAAYIDYVKENDGMVRVTTRQGEQAELDFGA